MPTILITGCSRGIGLELARQYADDPDWQLIATCRDPAAAGALRDLAAGNPRIRVHALDVTDHAQVDDLAGQLAGTAIDVLLNNAGIGARQAKLGEFNYAQWRQVLETNLLAPVKMAESFLPHVLAGSERKILSISSSLGSVSSAGPGNTIYRTSKAALNMAMRSMAAELKGRGVLMAVLSPGIVDTDFTAGTTMPKISAIDSAAGLKQVISELTLEQAGSFLRYNRATVPW